MVATKSEWWRTGFQRIIAAFNASAGQVLAQAYRLPDELLGNNSQRGKVTQAEGP
jgi:hypothetical protein